MKNYLVSFRFLDFLCTLRLKRNLTNNIVAGGKIEHLDFKFTKGPGKKEGED